MLAIKTLCRKERLNREMIYTEKKTKKRSRCRCKTPLKLVEGAGRSVDVSSYLYICVLAPLYMCPHTSIYVSSYLSSYCDICVYICVLVPLCMCRRASLCGSSCCDISVLIMCPHTSTCVLVPLLYTAIPRKDGGRLTISGNLKTFECPVLKCRGSTLCRGDY